MPQKIDMLPGEWLEWWFGGEYCEQCGGGADDHNVEVIAGHWSPRCLHPLPEGLSGNAKQAELARRITRKKAHLPLIGLSAASSKQADVPNVLGETDAESKERKSDNRNTAFGGSGRLEIWAITLFHSILLWWRFPGWEARVVRNDLVYRERLRHAFEAFDEGDYTAAFVLFKRDADSGSVVAQYNIGVLY